MIIKDEDGRIIGEETIKLSRPSGPWDSNKGTKVTKYCVQFKIQASKEILTLSYDSMSERAIAIIMYSPYCDVIREWTE